MNKSVRRYAVWDCAGVWAVADTKEEAVEEAVEAVLMDPAAVEDIVCEYLAADAYSGYITPALYERIERDGKMPSVFLLDNGTYGTEEDKKSEDAEREFQRQQLKLFIDKHEKE